MSRGGFGEPGASAAQARGRRQQPAFPSHQVLVSLPRFACTPASRRPWWSPAAAPSTRSRYPPGQSTATTRRTPTGVSAGTPPPHARHKALSTARPCLCLARTQRVGKGICSPHSAHTAEHGSCLSFGLRLTVFLIACHSHTPQECRVEDLTV